MYSPLNCYRNFDRFSGGHLKVWDYFSHVRAAPCYVPYIYFSDKTRWDDTNPWLGERNNALRTWDVAGTDILFLEGTDWKMLTEGERRDPPVPIVNLIQHVRHGDPLNKRYRYLQHKAVRICVSQEVGQAIEASGQVNGPVFVVPQGLDVKSLPVPVALGLRPIDVLIAGLKQRELAASLAKGLQALGSRVEVLTRQIPRQAYLESVSRSRITVFLPNPTEGCYLPALEGMALETLVICPDGVGTSYCAAGENCLRPDYTEEAILDAVHRACRLAPAAIATILTNARVTVSRHSLESERHRFLDILNNLQELW